jgi:hypothetical protein
MKTFRCIYSKEIGDYGVILIDGNKKTFIEVSEDKASRMASRGFIFKTE